MRFRDVCSWKPYFHHVLLPALRRFGPERADRTLATIGQALAAPGTPRRRWLRTALEPLGMADPSTVAALAAGMLRFRARDYLLETTDDAFALDRFVIDPAERAAFDAALDVGRGVILVGGHFGAHLSAFHWFHRRGVPFRAMAQRPRHVSAWLRARFDDDGDDNPQSGFFLSRGLGPTACVERVLRVRAAVRAGRAVYFAGDVPWSGPNTRPGRILGVEHPLLAVWADLAALTAAPVFQVLCVHLPGGRFGLSLEPLGPVRRGEEEAAVSRFCARLDRAIAERPDEATAHLLWPCYAPAAHARPQRGTIQVPVRRSTNARAGFISATSG